MALPTACRIPYCTYCSTKIWVTGTAKLNDPSSGIRAGQVFPLWPDPTSLYAKLATKIGYAPGVAFCMACAPKVGQPALEGFGPVVEYETAQERYKAWYAPEKEVFLRAWLRDALSWEQIEIESLIARWRKDCRG